MEGGIAFFWVVAEGRAFLERSLVEVHSPALAGVHSSCPAWLQDCHWLTNARRPPLDNALMIPRLKHSNPPIKI